MELREGNAFIHICVSVILSGGGEEACMTITYDALDLAVQVPLALPPWYWHLVVATKAR